MKFIKAIVFILVATFFVAAQSSGKNQAEEYSDFPVVARGGWTSPAFAEDAPPFRSDGYELIEGVPVQRKLYTLARVHLVYAESCDESIATKSDRNKFAVREYRTFEYKGKILAYSLNYFGVFTKGPSIEYLGCLRSAIYTDMDGDGRFELFCDRERKMLLPFWVKAADETGANPVFFRNADASDARRQSVGMIETNIPSDGWTGPAFAFAEISGQNSYDWIDDVDTQTKRYSPEKAVLAHFEDCQMGSGNRAVTKNGRKDFVIKDFTTYETKDRLYAYLITGWAVTGPGENTAAAASSLIFLDEKGDGRFERRCGVEEVGSLPQWVRDLGTLEVKSKR